MHICMVNVTVTREEMQEKFHKSSKRFFMRIMPLKHILFKKLVTDG